MNNYYKISKNELLELLYCRIKLDALEASGVDNWEWYGINFSEVAEEYKKNFEGKIPSYMDTEDFDLEDCALLELTNNYVAID